MQKHCSKFLHKIKYNQGEIMNNCSNFCRCLGISYVPYNLQNSNMAGPMGLQGHQGEMGPTGPTGIG